MKHLFLFLFLFLCLSLMSQENISHVPTTDVYNGGRGISFNDDWNFYHGNATGAQAITFNDLSWRKLNLPHDFGIENPFNPSSPSTSEGGFLDGGIGWYRKSFNLPVNNENSISITFDGSFMNTEVWINGHSLGIRPYGFITFQYDLTPYLTYGSLTNVIAVKVNNVQKSCRWYSGSGIYRNVWLNVLNPIHVAFCGSAVTTPLVSTSTANVIIKTDVENQTLGAQEVKLLSNVLDNTGALVATGIASTTSIPVGSTGTFSTSITVDNPTLWSMENPYLYTLKTYVINNTVKVDSFTTTLGLRNAVFDANKGFSLNGKTVKIHGVCLHQDLGSLGSAQNYRALERQVEIMKSMGVNGIRTSHNPPAPELLEICDRLGLVVMNEIFDCWSEGKDPNDYHLYYSTWMPQDVKNWVIRDRNHPSVIMWSAGNEIPGQDNSSGVTNLTNIMKEIKKYDNSKPISQGISGEPYPALVDILDIGGFNYATGSRYDSYHAAHPKTILFGSETSSAVRSRGVYHTPVTSNILTATDLQCSSYDNSIVYWGQSAEDSWKYDRDRPFVAGQFIWTGFDYIGEPSPYNNKFPVKSSYFGIVDLCGFPKDIFYFYQSQWTPKPMVHVLPHWNWEPGSTIPVWAYTNCDSVRLIVNEKSLGAKRFVTGGALHLEWMVPFVPGSVKAYAFKGGVIVARDSVTTAGSPSKLELKVDRSEIQANGLDLAFIETNILDDYGVFCPKADSLINYSITGPGKIVGVDNGNPISVESFKGTSRTTFNGKSLAVVQSTGTSGKITLTASTYNYPKNIALGKTTLADSENTTQLKNISIGKSITADSQESNNVASNAIDGNLTSRWCASDGNANHWLKIDLGANLNLIGAEIMWEQSGIAYLYKIETSTDNLIWSKVVDNTITNANKTQTQRSDFTSTARYIRLTITGGVSSSVWASLFEFRVFDGSTIPMTNGDFASKGNDNNLSTSWTAADGNSNHWWMVDLGENVPVTGSELNWINSGVAYQYKIEASTDQKIWSTVADKSLNTSLLQKQKDIYSTTARYLRVTITGGVSSMNKANIAEFKVFDGTTSTFTPASVIINAVANTVTNLIQPRKTSGFKVFPNPTGSILNIELSDNQLSRNFIELYNSLGQKVITRTFNKNSNKFQLDLSGNRIGIYFLKINGETEKIEVFRK